VIAVAVTVVPEAVAVAKLPLLIDAAKAVAMAVVLVPLKVYVPKTVPLLFVKTSFCPEAFLFEIKMLQTALLEEVLTEAVQVAWVPPA
jgi:hypothetical protein